jgi:hypothetical protein
MQSTMALPVGTSVAFFVHVLVTEVKIAMEVRGPTASGYKHRQRVVPVGWLQCFDLCTFPSGTAERPVGGDSPLDAKIPPA